MDITRKVFDYGTWVIFALITLLSTLFYVSKDAVPGNFLFGAKLATEKVLIAGSAILNKQVDTQLDFVARRYSEVSKVLASKYGSESLKRLDTQVVETAQTIAMIEDPEERKEAAARYSEQLNSISTGLSQEQAKITASRPTQLANDKTNTTSDSYSPPSFSFGDSSSDNIETNSNSGTSDSSYSDSYEPPTNSYTPPSSNTNDSNTYTPPADTYSPSNNENQVYPTQPAQAAPINPIQPESTITNQDNVNTSTINSQINNTQTTIQQTINQMNQIQQGYSTPTVSPPTSAPTINLPGNSQNQGNQSGNNKNKDKNNDNNKD